MSLYNMVPEPKVSLTDKLFSLLGIPMFVAYLAYLGLPVIAATVLGFAFFVALIGIVFLIGVGLAALLVPLGINAGAIAMALVIAYIVFVRRLSPPTPRTNGDELHDKADAIIDQMKAERRSRYHHS